MTNQKRDIYKVERADRKLSQVMTGAMKKMWTFEWRFVIGVIIDGCYTRYFVTCKMLLLCCNVWEADGFGEWFMLLFLLIVFDWWQTGICGQFWTHSKSRILYTILSLSIPFPSPSSCLSVYLLPPPSLLLLLCHSLSPAPPLSLNFSHLSYPPSPSLLWLMVGCWLWCGLCGRERWYSSGYRQKERGVGEGRGGQKSMGYTDGHWWSQFCNNEWS